MALREGGDYNDMISPGFGPEEKPRTPEPSPPAAETVEKVSEKKSWVHRHPYLASTVAVSGLLIFGTILVLQRVDVSPADSSGAWGGAGGLFFNGIRAVSQYRPSADDVTKAQSAGQAVSFIPLPNISTNTEQQDEPTPNEDIAALLSLLVQPSASGDAAVEPTTPDGYSLIPQGLVSAEAPPEKTRTAAQEDLFDYGNEVGIFVKGFEDTHRNMPQILKDHVEDRSDPEKVQSIEYLGLDFAQLGYDMLQMQGVPESAQAMHTSYSNGYRIVGTNLTKIAETQTDEEFLEAITIYNRSVEELTKRFLLLVALFSANEVTFSSSDPGNIFMFNPNLSLLQ